MKFSKAQLSANSPYLRHRASGILRIPVKAASRTDVMAATIPL
jgi:hypothetical protein